jgi:diguanylate cyclase (GGDEF)-like protein/PAS domain S-box-containing protein
VGLADRKALQHQFLLSGGTLILFLLAATLRDHVSQQFSAVAETGPRNAIVFGILVAYGRNWRDIVAIVSGGLIGNILFHVGRGDPATTTALFCFVNLTEGLLALLILRRLAGAGHAGQMFDRVGDVLALIVAAALATIPSSLLGAFALSMSSAGGFTEGFSRWYASGILSQILVVPMVVTLAQLGGARRLRTIKMRGVAEAIGIFALVALLTTSIFALSTLPLIFLITPVVLFATLRLRAFGAVGAVTIVAFISIFTTALGHGPIIAELPDPSSQLLVLQLFLACCFLTALPVAAMLTERDTRDEDARQLAERFKAVVENIGEVIFRIDCEGRWAYLNPAWETLSGYRIADCLGDGWLDRVAEPEREELAGRLQAMLRGEGQDTRREIRFHTATGARWMEIYFQCMRGQDGAVIGATGTLRDINDRKRLEEHVMTAKSRAEQRAREAILLASTDELTGIANRRSFMRQLEREVAGAAEFGWPLAVAIFDVDHFKRVNDRNGHAVGDKVLQVIAARAAAAVRGGDLVGRLGGDELGILMPGASVEDATSVAERVRLAIETPRTDEPDLPCVTVSIGIASRHSQREAALLLADADAALYAAKGAGRNRIRLAA